MLSLVIALTTMTFQHLDFMDNFIFCRTAASRWNTFRTLCDSSSSVDLVLDITADIPNEQMINRWLSEPLKAISISTKIFFTNKKGYPVLSKPHQSLLHRLYKVGGHGKIFTNCFVFLPFCELLVSSGFYF